MRKVDDSVLRPIAKPHGPAFRDPGRSIERALLTLLLFAAFAINIYFVSPSVAGLPLRFICMLLLLAAFLVFNTRDAFRALLAARAPLLLIVYLAFVGVGLAVYRGELAPAVAELIAIHLQATVILLVATIGAFVVGPRAVMWAFAAAVGFSCLFSILQYLGVQPAIAARDLLGTVRVEASDVADAVDRAPGLSYSTIFLAQQCCMLFAVALFFHTQVTRSATRSRPGPQTVRRIAAIGLWSVGLFLISLISGNRSPILGLLIFLSLVISSRDKRLLMLAVPVIVAFYFLVDPLRDMAADAGLRIGQSGDKSELARQPLWAYGLRLLANNPIGYGLTFDSRSLSNTVHTSDLVAFLHVNQMAKLLTEQHLHNFFITITNIYGLFLLPVVLFCVNLVRKNWGVFLLFLPYIVHIFFHNAGPFFGDYLFWIPIGIIVAATDLQEQRRRLDLGLKKGSVFRSPLPRLFMPVEVGTSFEVHRLNDRGPQ